MSYFVSISVKCRGTCTYEYFKHRSVVFTTLVHRHNLAGQGEAHDLAMFLYLKADSYIACRAAKGLECVFPI
jgi:hypothetical protein